MASMLFADKGSWTDRNVFSRDLISEGNSNGNGVISKSGSIV